MNWAAVWAEHGTAMLDVARSQLRGRVADGYTDEDIVSEVLNSVIKNPSGLQDAENERAYLAGAVRNRCRTKLKRGRRQVVREIQALEPDGHRGRDPVGDRATDATLASAIAACLDRLTTNQQCPLLIVR